MTENFDRNSGSPVASAIHFLLFMAAAGFIGWVLYRIVLFLGLKRWLREPSFGLDGFWLGLIFLFLIVFPPLGMAFDYRHIHGAGDVIGCTLLAVFCASIGFYILRRETTSYIIRKTAELTAAYQEMLRAQNHQDRESAESRSEVG